MTGQIHSDGGIKIPEAKHADGQAKCSAGADSGRHYDDGKGGIYESDHNQIS